MAGRPPLRKKSGSEIGGKYANMWKGRKSAKLQIPCQLQRRSRGASRAKTHPVCTTKGGSN